MHEFVDSLARNEFSTKLSTKLSTRGQLGCQLGCQLSSQPGCPQDIYAAVACATLGLTQAAARPWSGQSPNMTQPHPYIAQLGAQDHLAVVFAWPRHATHMPDPCAIEPKLPKMNLKFDPLLSESDRRMSELKISSWHPPQRIKNLARDSVSTQA